MAPTAIEHFDPTRERMLIIGNMIDWTVSVTGDDAVRYYAISASDYSLIRSFDRPLDSSSVPGLHFTSANDNYCYPRF